MRIENGVQESQDCAEDEQDAGLPQDSQHPKGLFRADVKKAYSRELVTCKGSVQTSC